MLIYDHSPRLILGFVNGQWLNLKTFWLEALAAWWEGNVAGRYGGEV